MATELGKGTMLPFTFSPMTEEHARTISTWRYGGPYAVYDLSRDSIQSLLHPRYDYYAVTDESGQVVGYCCFGADAQVPGGRYGDQKALDVGLGLRPDLTGKGLGSQFLTTILDFAQERYHPAQFRLTVATFNRRAIRVYEQAGCQRSHLFSIAGTDGQRDYVQMTLTASS